MIVRNIIFFLLLIVLPDLWIDYHYLRPRKSLPVSRRLLWWVPCVVMLAYTCWLSAQDSFIPRERWWVDAYLWLLGLLVIPKAAFVLWAAAGSALGRLWSPLRRWGRWLGYVAAVAAACLFAYGSTWGFCHLVVRTVTLTYDSLPDEFDGFRIVQVSDLHVGTYTGWRSGFLSEVVDSIEARHADIVCFTGDLQNVSPDEVEVRSNVLSRLHNVYSVLGNHDYADYALFRRQRNEGRAAAADSLTNRMRQVQRQELGFTLLDNSHCRISRGDACIYVVGTGNYSRPPKSPDQPSLDYSDYGKALEGIPDSSFIILLQHNPQHWSDVIMANREDGSNHLPIPQLTLSGHTHGGQIALGQLRITRMAYPLDYGFGTLYRRCIGVTGGVGGLVPVRLGVPPEIVEITLRKNK